MEGYVWYHNTASELLENHSSTIPIQRKYFGIVITFANSSAEVLEFGLAREYTNSMTTPLNMHAARSALNKDSAFRQWAERWLKEKERESVPSMSNEEFERRWRYVTPERMHECALEAFLAYQEIPRLETEIPNWTDDAIWQPK